MVSTALSVLKFGHRVRAWYRRRVLLIWTQVFLLMLLLVTLAALTHLWKVSSERAQSIRQELFQRDLRDLVGRFDSDERYVLDHNLAELLTERRTLRPLLLPRQYYIGLPPGARAFLPRQPPRNCFVNLVPTGEVPPSPSDRICTYFAESRAAGRYLFVDATFADDDLVALRPGDTQFKADAVKLSVSANSTATAWWLVFQPSPYSARSDRYDLTAFREVDGLRRDRDKKVEGWAYLQPQANGTRLVHLIARIEFKEFLNTGDDEEWPPEGWHKTQIRVERRNASSDGAVLRDYAFLPDGPSELSLSTLGAQIYGSYGSLAVERVANGASGVWRIQPPATLDAKLDAGKFGIKVSEGDLLISSSPTSHSEALPDTSVSLRVSHPWRLIEKGFWQIALYLLALFGGGLFVTRYFNRNLLEPLADWSRHSEQLTLVRTDASVELPYGERNNEVGVLARAFNALIQSVRDQTVRDAAERAARDADARKRQEIEVRNREQNLQVIGHEIRSPLQALVALHTEPNDPSKRHIDRMLAALPHLLGGAATADAIGARAMTMEELDIAEYVRDVAKNAAAIGIKRVAYSGPSTGIYSLVDDGAFDDALTNILTNGDRHRIPDTDICLIVSSDEATVTIDIMNDGPHVPEALLERIFELGFSTLRPSASGGQGMGLYVARTYIEKMGGSLAVRNHAQGVTFTIKLPISAASLI
jgi:signal transduction histidine kinase